MSRGTTLAVVSALAFASAGGGPAPPTTVAGEARAAPLAVDLGPVTYRVVRLEALRFRGPAGPDGEDLGDAGRWRGVDDGRGDDGDGDLARAALLADLHAADGPPPATARAGPPADRSAGEEPRRGRPARADAWRLVVTWEAAAVVRCVRGGAGTLRVARARRAVAVPLPPPDVGATGRRGPAAGRPPWPAALTVPPPPHPDPDDAPPRRPAAPAFVLRPPATASPLARAIAHARAGDPVAAAAALPATTPAAPTDDLPEEILVEAIVAAAWRGEILLGVGRAREAAEALEAAAGLASADPGSLDGAPGRTAVVAFLRERAACAAARPGAPPPPGPAADDRTDAAPTDDDGLATVRRDTEAFWRATRSERGERRERAPRR